jgi:hypothetical protein
MSRLPTTVINAASVGTGSNKGERLYAAALTLQSTTNAFSVELEVTNGAINNQSKEVIVRYAITSNTYSAAAGAIALHQSSRYVSLKLGANGGDIRSRVSFLEPANGANLHVWLEAPDLTVAATATVKVVEHYT